MAHPWQVAIPPDPMTLMQLSQGIAAPFERMRKMDREEEMNKYNQQQALFRKMMGLGGQLAMKQQKPTRPRVSTDVAEKWYADTGDTGDPPDWYVENYRDNKEVGRRKKAAQTEYTGYLKRMKGKPEEKQIAENEILGQYPDAYDIVAGKPPRTQSLAAEPELGKAERGPLRQGKLRSLIYAKHLGEIGRTAAGKKIVGGDEPVKKPVAAKTPAKSTKKILIEIIKDSPGNPPKGSRGRIEEWEFDPAIMKKV